MHEIVNKKILAALMYDDEFARLAWATLKPEHFEDSTYWTLAGIAYRFFEKYNRAMRDFAEKEITEHITDSGLAPEKAEALMLLYGEMRFSQSDIEIARQEVIEFSRHAALREVLEEFIELHESGRANKSSINKIIASVEDTQRIGERHTLRTDLISGLKSRFNRRLDLDNQFISTLIDPLDARFIGAQRGELCTIMAPPGKGKSWMLGHLAQAAHIQGLHVLHVSYEMSAERLEERHDMMISGSTRGHLTIPSVMKKIRLAYEQAERVSVSGRIQVEWLPAGLPIARTQQLIEAVIDETQRPLDVVCLDYGNLIRPNEQTGFAYTDQGQVWEELTNFVKQYHIVIWVATQTNRAGTGAKYLSEFEIGDSLLKYNHSDIFIGFNRSLIRNSQGKWVQIDDEWQGDDDQRIRLHVMKHRSGEGDKYTINFMSDFFRGLFYSKKLTTEKLITIEIGEAGKIEAQVLSAEAQHKARTDAINQDLNNLGVFS